MKERRKDKVRFIQISDYMTSLLFANFFSLKISWKHIRLFSKTVSSVNWRKFFLGLFQWPRLSHAFGSLTTIKNNLKHPFTNAYQLKDYLSVYPVILSITFLCFIIKGSRSWLVIVIFALLRFIIGEHSTCYIFLIKQSIEHT